MLPSNLSLSQRRRRIRSKVDNCRKKNKKRQLLQVSRKLIKLTNFFQEKLDRLQSDLNNFKKHFRLKIHSKRESAYSRCYGRGLESTNLLDSEWNTLKFESEIKSDISSDNSFLGFKKSIGSSKSSKNSKKSKKRKFKQKSFLGKRRMRLPMKSPSGSLISAKKKLKVGVVQKNRNFTTNGKSKKIFSNFFQLKKLIFNFFQSPQNLLIFFFRQPNTRYN